MMKKLVSLLLVAVMLFTMAPIYAFAYDEEEYFARYDVTLKSVSTACFTYTIGGKEYRSDLTGSKINYTAWTMMTDEDKKKAAKAFIDKRDRDETFGAENSAEVAGFVSAAQGYTAVANKLKEKVEKKYISNDLIEIFSDTIVDKDEDLSYFQRTINTEFEIEDYDEVVYKYEFFIDSHSAKKAYADARYAMDCGHEIYQKLRSLHELAWQMSVKATAGELGKYLANNAIVPPITPGAGISELKDAAWGFVKDLASQLKIYKTKSDIIQELLYGKDIVSKDDACKIIKEVNELADMYEEQCRECYEEAKYQIRYVKSLMKNLRKLNADYDKKVEEYRIQAQKDMEEAVNPEPDTVVQEEIEEDIKNAPVATDPGHDTSNTTAEHDAWINSLKSYHRGLNARAVALKSTNEKLEREWETFESDYTAWRNSWDGTIKKLVDDGIPDFSGEYSEIMLYKNDRFFSDMGTEDRFHITSSEYNLRKKSAKNISNYYDNLSFYFSRHIKNASSTLETEMEKFKKFQQRYLDLQEAGNEFNRTKNELYNEIYNHRLWNITDDVALQDSAMAILEELSFEHSYSEIHDKLGEVDNEIKINFTKLKPLSVIYPLNTWYCNSHYVGEKRGAEYKCDTDNNILTYSYYVISGQDFIELLESQIDDEEQKCDRFTKYSKELRDAFDAYDYERNEYIEAMRTAVNKYNTARDNYELARMKYIPALEDMKNLNNQLPDYVRQQALISVVYYLKATYRSDNPIIYDDLHNTSNRAGAIAKYRSQLTTYYERYKKNLRIMENAYALMECYAREMDKQYDIFCWMHPEYIYHGESHNYFNDLGIFQPSASAYDEYDSGFGLLPNWYKFGVQRYRYNDNTYFIQLEALYNDFAGVNLCQTNADLCTHMLLINKSAIIHEGKNGNTKRLDAIYSKYNNARGTAYAHSWVGLGDDGENDPDFLRAYNEIQKAIDTYICVNKFGKGNKQKTRAIADLEIQEGETGQLSAYIEPANATDKTIIWRSKTPDIATVDENGRVTALNDGEAIIIAYPADSIAVAIDTEGNELDEEDDGTPIVPSGSVFGGYTYKLPDENGELEDAVLEYVVDVTADPTPGAEWNKVKPYNGVYDGNCHFAIDTTGLNNYDVTYSVNGGEDYTDICPAIDVAGDYSIRVKLTPAFDSEAEGETRDFTASIDKFDLTNKEINVIYGQQAPVDGEEHDAVIYRVLVDDMEIPAEDYEIISGNKAITITPQAIVISGLNSFEGISAPSAEKWTLQKPELTIDDFDILPINAVAYTGNAVEVAPPTARRNGIGSIIVKYDGSREAPVDAGEYEVTFDVEEGDLFVGAKDFELGTLVINKIDYDGDKASSGRVEIGYDDMASLKLPDLPKGASYCVDEASISGDSPEIISNLSWDSYSFGEYLYCYINAGNEPTSAEVTIPVKDARNYNDYEIVFTVKVYDPECNHSWNDGTIITPPSCNDFGVIEYECTICGAVESRYMGILDHSFEMVETPATCTEDGKKTFTCTNCGYVYYEPIYAKGHSIVTDNAVPATCTEAGLTEGSHCSICNETIIEQMPTERLSHNTTTTTKKATLSKNGRVVTKCTVCGTTTSSKTIAYPKEIKLSATSYTYDGKVKKPSVTVKGSDGKKISSSNYTVSYAKGRKSVGKYSVKVTFKGKYSGSKTLYFTIKPKATSISSVKATSKGFTIKWKKQATQTTGYEIQYSTDKNFKKNNKTITVTKNSTTSKKITKLKGKKKYYVRIRTYKKVSGQKYCSAWSSSKSVTTKK